MNHGDIYHQFNDSQQIKESNLKERSSEFKKERTGDGDFSYLRSGWHGCFKLLQWFCDQGSSNS